MNISDSRIVRIVRTDHGRYRRIELPNGRVLWRKEIPSSKDHAFGLREEVQRKLEEKFQEEM